MSSVDLKLRRAKEHLHSVRQQAGDYLAGRPFAVETVDHPEAGRRDWVVRVRQEPPVELALAVGDCIHNARSALDHLAWDLVVAGGGSPDQSTDFPIKDSVVGWGDKARKSLRGHGLHAAREAIKALQPWKGGNEALWRLHHLDIVDKHRLVSVVLAHYRGVVIGGGSWTPWSNAPDRTFVMPELYLKAADQEPVHDGYVGFSAPLSTTPDPITGNPKIALDLALGPGSELSGVGLSPLLGELVGAAESAVADVRSACGVDLRGEATS